MKVYLCALAKNEHLYINEFVSHYIKLGVDKIFIFDNDDKQSPYIKDYIEEQYLPQVRIINARGLHKPKIQHEFYNNFYHVEKDNFDWCIFCDIDEFLVGVDNIKKFLSSPRFNIAQQIRIKWKLFGDDNLITRDTSKPLLGAFKKEVTETFSMDLQSPANLQIQGKSIIKGHLKDILIDSPHYARYGSRNRILISVLPSGKICNSTVAIKEDYSKETVFFHHYMTKSLSEFINQKMNRTDAVFGERILKLNYYWRINKKNKKKLEYLKNLGLE